MSNDVFGFLKELVVFDSTAPTFKELYQPEQTLVMIGFFFLTWILETLIVNWYNSKFKFDKLFLSVGVANWLTYFIGFIIYSVLYPETTFSTLAFFIINLFGAFCIIALWFYPEEKEENEENE